MAFSTAPDDVLLDVLKRCETIGRQVRVQLSAERSVEGIADRIDEDGRLVVRTNSGSVTYGAGDVIHLQS